MKIKLKSNLLLIKKHKSSKLAVDMAIEDNDEDKGLITGEVLDGEGKGDTVIFGKYSLLTFTLQGEDYNVLDKDDVLGTCDYREE